MIVLMRARGTASRQSRERPHSRPDQRLECLCATIWGSTTRDSATFSTIRRSNGSSAGDFCEMSASLSEMWGTALICQRSEERPLTRNHSSPSMRLGQSIVFWNDLASEQNLQITPQNLESNQRSGRIPCNEQCRQRKPPLIHSFVQLAQRRFMSEICFSNV
jgi:hypothetical protein